MHDESDDLPREMVHDDHYPMGFEDKRFAAEEIDAPQTVFAVAEKRQPGWASRSWFWPIVIGEHAPHHILVDLNIENQGNLIGNALITESWIPAFHRHNG